MTPLQGSCRALLQTVGVGGPAKEPVQYFPSLDNREHHSFEGPLGKGKQSRVQEVMSGVGHLVMKTVFVRSLCSK